MSSSVQEMLKVGGLGSLLPEVLVLSSELELVVVALLLDLCEFSALLIRALRKLIIMMRDLASTLLPSIEVKYPQAPITFSRYRKIEVKGLPLKSKD